jgi:hypothetical protein
MHAEDPKVKQWNSVMNIYIGMNMNTGLIHTVEDNIKPPSIR